jgi:2-keto-4-pentenoate hydratase/2-oxohepta-3-ene-1,7-dioic acid hydratase in catechol pathway
MTHIIRFRDRENVIRWGVVQPDDFSKANPLVSNPLTSLDIGPDPVEVDTVLPPLEPVNIFAVGLNYRGHATEQGLTDEQLPKSPMIFMKATTAVIGPGNKIELPAAAPDCVDYEAELAVIIGKRCRFVSKDAALSRVLGYTCANDVSARDCQRADRQYVRAKSFDTFCPLGPAIVTADSFDPRDVRIRSLLNGEVMQDARTRELLFDVAGLISFMSHQFTLLPGTVILTGTPAGVGFARKPPVFLKPGDVIAVEIEGIGRLENSVVATGG